MLLLQRTAQPDLGATVGHLVLLNPIQWLVASGQGIRGKTAGPPLGSGHWEMA